MRSRARRCSAGLTLLGLLACSPPVAGAPLSRLAAATSYCCYYGPPAVAKLSRYNLAIIEARRYTPAQISSLRSTTITIGYCSIGELDPEESDSFSGTGRWFQDRDLDGKPDRNGAWGSFYADPADPSWRAFVLSKVDHLVNTLGCDGVFLDTLDTIDEYPASYAAMAELVHLVRERHPDRILIANRGFSLMPRIASDVDGVMFECFTTCHDAARRGYRRFTDEELSWTHLMYTQHLRRFQEEGGVILALDYARTSQKTLINQAWSRALDYGFLPCIAERDLARILTVKPRPDPAFLKRYGRAAMENRR